MSAVYNECQGTQKKFDAFTYIEFYIYTITIWKNYKTLGFILIKYLFEVEFASLMCLLTFKTYRSGMFLDPRGDFAGLGMASLEFNDYPHVVRYRGRNNGIRLLQNSIHNSE